MTAPFDLDGAPARFAAARRALRRQRFLLVAPIPFARDPAGRAHVDALWAHDLLRHFDYLSDVTVLAPEQAGPPPPDWAAVAAPAGVRLDFRALPPACSMGEALRGLPTALRAAVRAVSLADVVQSGAAGWPIPPGFLATPLAVWRRRGLVIVVESAFWRLVPGRPASLAARLRAAVTESFARWSVRRADLSVFTHDGYRRDLAGGARGEMLVTPAAWIAAADLIAPAAAEALWAARPARPRVLLAARLTPEKGIAVALDAAARLAARGADLGLDIIGSGPMLETCRMAASRWHGLRVLDPVPYGAPFLSLLRGYHALIVPSLTDEQPRVILDAASQAVGAIASDTEGHRALVSPGRNGLLLPAGDAAALAGALAALDIGQARGWGLAARQDAAALTHEVMHLRRAEALARLFGDEAKSVPAKPG